MQPLLDGIHRFQTGYHAANADLFAALEEGQRPQTLFITCSDSRVKPTLITDTRPGEIFELRNAGNMMPSYEQARATGGGEAATLQYAVEVLRVRHIVVCGHTDCRTIKALIDPPARVDGLEFVDQWVDQAADLRGRIPATGEADDRHRHLAAIEQNVLLQLDDVLSYPFVKRHLAAGRLMVHGWVFHIGSGQVTTYDPVRDAFCPVHDVYTPAPTLNACPV